MASNFFIPDPILGQIDADQKFITNAWLVDQFVGTRLFAWGTNGANAILGISAVNGYYSSPVQVGSLSNWSQIASSITSFGIKNDGTLWSWGQNSSGSLGQNTATTYYSSPVQVGALTNWRQVTASLLGSILAVQQNGELFAWGHNNVGQLGNGTTGTNYSSPIQIGTDTKWSQVSCAYNHTLAVKTDGTLWAWGENNDGQLGNNSVVNVSTPIQIGGDTKWKQVVTGITISMAVKTDGTLWSWGSSGEGSSAQNTLTNFSSPVQVGGSGGLTNWKQVAVGHDFMMAIKTDGTLWTSGLNNLGQLGLINTTYYSSPVQIVGSTNWKQVSCGYMNTAAVRADGTLWTWGGNDSGQLGATLPLTAYYSSPIQVGSLNTWKNVFCNSSSGALGEAVFGLLLQNI